MPPNQPPPARKRPTSSQPPVVAPARTSGPRPVPTGQRRAVAESKLVCTAGPKAGTEFPLVGDDDVVIGRATDNAISVPDTSVSRKHAQLRRLSDGWAASDLGSGNGTMVNGERIAEETVLRNGDVVTLGDTELTFQDLTDTERRPMPVRRTSGGAPAVAPLARRNSIPGRPDVRARLSRAGAPIIDPAAQKRKKRLMIIGASLLAVVLAGLVGVQIVKNKRDATKLAAQAIQDKQRAQLADMFQEAKNLVREGKWAEAKTKLEELKAIRGGYPGVDDYLDRAGKEIPNEKNLGLAEAALQKGDIPAAADALSKVSPDTLLSQKLIAVQQAMDTHMGKLIEDARNANGSGDINQVKALTDVILKVQPNNRDAKSMNDQAVAAIAIRDAPVKPIVGPAPKPWESGISRFMEGDISGAIALEDECAARKVSKCKGLASEMREFIETYKKLDDLDVRGLKKLLALDHEITEVKGHSKAGRTAGIKLGTQLCKSATAAKAAAQYARAAELATSATAADPGNNCAGAILSELKSKAHELYMFAYSLKDQDPDQAVEKFKQVIQMTTPDNEDHEKAAKWLGTLQH